MSRPKVDDSHKRQGLRYGQGAEIGIVRQHDPAMGCGVSEDRGIGVADQSRLPDIHDIEALRAQVRDHIGMEVLIGQEWEVAKFQATPAVR